MATGQIIGRVSVKVMPETGDFKKDAERKLNSIEKALKMEVPVLLDPNKLRAEARNAVRQVNNAIKGNDQYKVRFDATIARSSMASEISKARTALENKAKTEKIKFHADLIAVAISGELDKDSLKHVKKELEDWRDKVSPLKVSVKPELTLGFASAVSARLEYLTRPRTVAIIPMLNGTAVGTVATGLAALSGARVLSNMFEDMWNSLKKLDKAVPMIAAVSTGLVGLGGSAMASASNLFALSASLAQIAPAALALPGIFGGMAIGLGATVAVLKDFNTVLPNVGDAFSNLQDRMSSKFWEVAAQPMRDLIWGLLPELSAGLEKTSTELGGFFATLSSSLQGQFGGALAGMFADLSESIAIASKHTDDFAQILRILGEVGAGYLPRLAAWFGDISNQFSTFLQKSQDSGAITEWIDTGIERIKELGSVLSGVGSILSGLAAAASAAGGSSLGMLADSLHRIADVVNGPAFQDVLIGVLNASHTAMERIANLSGPALSGFFESFGRTLTSILPMVGTTIGKLGDALFSALANPAVQGGFKTMMTGISEGISGLLPAFDAVAPAFGALMEVVGALAANLGPVLAAAFGVLGPVVTQVATALIPLIDMLGPLLQDAITMVAPLIAQIGSALVEVAIAAQPLIAKFGELMNVVGPILMPVLGLLVTIIKGAVIGAFNGLIQMFDGVIGIIGGFKTVWDGIVLMFTDFPAGVAMIWDGVVQIFKGAFNVIVGAFKVWMNIGILGALKGGALKILSLWKGAWTGIKTAALGIWNGIKFVFSAWMLGVKTTLTTVLNSIKTLWSTIWNGIKTVATMIWSGISGAVSGAINAVKNTITTVMNNIALLWGAAWTGIKLILTNAWTAIKGAVSTGITNMLALVKAIPGKIKSALGNAKTMLVDTGKQIVAGLASGIESAKQWVIDKVKALGDLIPGWLKKKLGIQSPSRVTKEIGKFVGKGFALGIAGTQGEINATMAKLLGMVNKTTDKGAKAIVQTAHRELLPLARQFEDFNTLIDNAKQAWEGARDAANEYAKGVSAAVVATGNLTTIQGLEIDPQEIVPDRFDVSYDDLSNGLNKALQDANEFNTLWDKLRKAGLNDTSLEQFVDAGPDALAAMRALDKVDGNAIAHLNQLQAQLQVAADLMAERARHQFKQAGIDILAGIVTGLEEDQGKVAAAMTVIAQEMVKALKKELGIKSPSRVFKALAHHVVNGLANGLGDDSKVLTATKALGNGAAMKDAGKTMIDGLIGGMESRYSKVSNSLSGMASDLAVNAPTLNDPAALQSAVSGALSADGTTIKVEQKVLQYNAAPNNSLDSEDDLFAAADRGRMVGW